MVFSILKHITAFSSVSNLNNFEIVISAHYLHFIINQLWLIVIGKESNRSITINQHLLVVNLDMYCGLENYLLSANIKVDWEGLK